MSVAEMKKTIHEKVENITSQQQLDVMLQVIKRFESNDDVLFDIDSIFEKAASRYGNTLQKLAQ